MKQAIRVVLKKAGLEVKRLQPPSPDPEYIYSRNGKIPWSHGYDQAKERFIQGVLSDTSFLETFRMGGTLPEQFGVGFDERCVEYPWLFSRLSQQTEQLLDAGSALNHAFILKQEVIENKRLDILTLAPEPSCFWYRGVSYLYCDLRDIPIRDEYYDAIACISTLEHVGVDDVELTSDRSLHRTHPNGFGQAIRELRRVLKPRGTLFLTVPFGLYRHYGTFQQFDRELLSIAVEEFGQADETFYMYNEKGWNISNAADCGNCEYVQWVASMWQASQSPQPVPVDRDMAAAARAVACVSLTK